MMKSLMTMCVVTVLVILVSLPEAWTHAESTRFELPTRTREEIIRGMRGVLREMVLEEEERELGEASSRIASLRVILKESLQELADHKNDMQAMETVLRELLKEEDDRALGEASGRISELRGILSKALDSHPDITQRLEL